MKTIAAFLAASCVVALPDHTEAECIMNGKTVAFFGDSITRYCFFGFNYWLETGNLPPDEYDTDTGNYAEDYDNGLVDNTWTEWHLDAFTNRRHRQWFAKNFPNLGNAFTEFRFIQDAYYDNSITGSDVSIADVADTVKDYDYIIYNTGLWNLKEKNDLIDDYCGEDWTTDCSDYWESMLNSLESVMWSDGATVVWRSTTCCGEEDGNLPSIEAGNAEAKDLVEGFGHSYVEVYDLWDEDNQDDFLFDDTHPNIDTCNLINRMVLQAIDDANGGFCTGGSPPPTYDPTSGPTPRPSFTPTYAPTPKPTPSPTPKPVASPTPKPTPIPVDSDVCADSTTWFKTNDPSRDCSWVASFTPTRCTVKGDNGNFAYQDCREACDTCPGPCSTADSTSWFRGNDPSRNCDWVADFYVNRCNRQSADGTYAFQACPYACRTCYGCEDDSEWSIQSDATKDCDWVAESSGSRCTRFGFSGDEALLAFLQCRDACQTCAGSAEVCEDDPNWYKSGEPFKDCAWVAAFAPAPRCTVKGEDGSFAYEHCHVACDTC